jgi:uncharacterized protein (DUF1778 family)
MSKVITLRLSDEEYQKISCAALGEHRPISNFITTVVMKDIAESYFVDPIEMDQIRSDKKLMAKLQRGHNEAKKLKGKLIG